MIRGIDKHTQAFVLLLEFLFAFSTLNPGLITVFVFDVFAETHINQLQYRLDKLKEEQGDREQVIRDQLDELETKKETSVTHCYFFFYLY